MDEEELKKALANFPPFELSEESKAGWDAINGERVARFRMLVGLTKALVNAGVLSKDEIESSMCAQLHRDDDPDGYESPIDDMFSLFLERLD